MRKRPRVVFDCNVFLSAAARKGGLAGQCLFLAESGIVELFVSAEVIAEIEDVLNRPAVRGYFPDLNDELVVAFLRFLQNIAVFVYRVPNAFRLPRDVKDEPYVNLAVAVGADFIVTKDKDLLDLVTGFANEAKEFRRRFRPMRVINPEEFLRLIEESKFGENLKYP